MRQQLEKATKWINAGGISRTIQDSFAGHKVKFGRTVLTGLLAALVLIALVGDIRGTFRAWQTAELAKERSKIVLQLNERSLARHVTYTLQKDSLQLAIAAAKALNGELVAALAIRTKPDTIRVPVSIVPTTTSGSTRSAFLTDTTELGYTITINAIAPPVPENIQIGYELTIPEFRPEVAFIRLVDGSMYASVSWERQRFVVEAPFFESPTNNRKPLRLNVGASLLLHANPALANTLFGQAYMAPEYETITGWRTSVPLGVSNHGFFMGVGVEKTIGQWTSLWDLINPF